jgi:hypothetical protein
LSRRLSPDSGESHGEPEKTAKNEKSRETPAFFWSVTLLVISRLRGQLGGQKAGQGKNNRSESDADVREFVHFYKPLFGLGQFEKLVVRQGSREKFPMDEKYFVQRNKARWTRPGLVFLPLEKSVAY